MEFGKTASPACHGPPLFDSLWKPLSAYPPLPDCSQSLDNCAEPFHEAPSGIHFIGFSDTLCRISLFYTVIPSQMIVPLLFSLFHSGFSFREIRDCFLKMKTPHFVSLPALILFPPGFRFDRRYCAFTFHSDRLDITGNSVFSLKIYPANACSNFCDFSCNGISSHSFDGVGYAPCYIHCSWWTLFFWTLACSPSYSSTLELTSGNVLCC